MNDLQFLVPLGGFLTAVAGVMMLFFTRSDKRRETRETAVQTLLNKQLEDLRRQLEESGRESRSRFRTGSRWRDQLIHNNIVPDPKEWPDMEYES